MASIPRYSYEQIYLREAKVAILKLNLPEELFAPCSNNELCAPNPPGELSVANESEPHQALQNQIVKPFRPWEMPFRPWEI